MSPHPPAAFPKDLFNIIPGGVYTVDSDCRITTWNKRAEEITGFAAKDMAGTISTDFSSTDCADACPVKSHLASPVEQANIGIVIVRERRIHFANSYFSRLVGLPLQKPFKINAGLSILEKTIAQNGIPADSSHYEE